MVQRALTHAGRKPIKASPTPRPAPPTHREYARQLRSSCNREQYKNLLSSGLQTHFHCCPTSTPTWPPLPVTACTHPEIADNDSFLASQADRIRKNIFSAERLTRPPISLSSWLNPTSKENAMRSSPSTRSCKQAGPVERPTPGCSNASKTTATILARRPGGRRQDEGRFVMDGMARHPGPALAPSQNLSLPLNPLRPPVVVAISRRDFFLLHPRVLPDRAAHRPHAAPTEPSPDRRLGQSPTSSSIALRFTDTRSPQSGITPATPYPLTPMRAER